MSTGDIAAIVVAITSVVAIVLLVLAVNQLVSTLASLRETSETLRAEGLEAFRRLQDLATEADAELDKVDLVLDRADAVTTALAETSKATYDAVASPVIKTVAMAAGTGRAARHLRRRPRTES